MDHYRSGSGINQEIDDQGFVLPAYAPYLSNVMLKLTVLIATLLLSSWMVYTIKKTSLHKSYYLFIGNLLVSDMIAAVLIFIIQCSMMISYQLGVKPLIGCYAYKFVAFGPLLVNTFSIVILSCDRVVATIFPTMYKNLKAYRVEAGIISGAWLLAVIPATYMMLSHVDGEFDIPKYGMCVFEQNAYKGAVYISIPFLVIILSGMLIAKAKCRSEAGNLTGINIQATKISTLKKIDFSIDWKGKLINIVLLVLFTFYVLLLLSGKFLNNSSGYQRIMIYVVVPNCTYIIQFFRSIVIGLYFKQVYSPIAKLKNL